MNLLYVTLYYNLTYLIFQFNKYILLKESYHILIYYQLYLALLDNVKVINRIQK